MNLSYGKYILKMRTTEYLYNIQKNNTDYHIAKILLNRIDEYPDFSIDEIAFLAKTTAPTVTKFLKKLGYTGFSQVRENADAIYEHFSIMHQLELASVDITSFSHSFSHQLEMINEKIYASLDQDQMKRIAFDLSQIKKIYAFTGIHGFASVNFFSELMTQFDITVYPINRDAEISLLCDAIHKSDLIFAISLTGQWLINTEKKLPPKELELFYQKAIILSFTKVTHASLYREYINFSNNTDIFLSNYYSDSALHAIFIRIAADLFCLKY